MECITNSFEGTGTSLQSHAKELAGATELFREMAKRNKVVTLLTCKKRTGIPGPTEPLRATRRLKMLSQHKTKQEKARATLELSGTPATYQNATRPTSGVRKQNKPTGKERNKLVKDRVFWEDLAQRKLARFDFPPSGLSLRELLRQGARPAWAPIQEQRQRNRPRTTKTKKERPRAVARERTIQRDTKQKDRDLRSNKQTKQKANRVCAMSNFNLPPTGTKDIACKDNKIRATTEKKTLDPQKIRRVRIKRYINPSKGTKGIGRRDDQLTQLATRQEKRQPTGEHRPPDTKSEETSSDKSIFKRASYLVQHTRKRTKSSRDGILRRHNERITRFHGASIIMSLRIQKLACKRKLERKRKTIVERLLEARLMKRDYRNILPIMVMTTIRAQHGKTPGHFISLKRPETFRTLTMILETNPEARETKGTRIVERGEGVNCQCSWLVPPWEEGYDPWQIPPWGHKRFGEKNTRKQLADRNGALDGATLGKHRGKEQRWRTTNGEGTLGGATLASPNNAGSWV